MSKRIELKMYADIVPDDVSIGNEHYGRLLILDDDMFHDFDRPEFMRMVLDKVDRIHRQIRERVEKLVSEEYDRRA